MPIGLVAAGIGAAGAIGGALIGSKASSNAAKAQTQAAELASQTQLQMYNQTRSDLQPFMNYGNNAFTQLANIFGFGTPGGQPNPGFATQLLTQFPGYQFGLSQGTEALDRSAASRGTALSGGQLKDITTFGQNYGMANAWQPYVSQLSQAASLGENAAAHVGNLGANAGSGIAQSQLAAGQSQAAGIVGGANQWTSAINGVTNAISPLFTSSYGGNAAAPNNFDFRGTLPDINAPISFGG